MEIATPVCALARNDVEIWWLSAFVRLLDKLKFDIRGIVSGRNVRYLTIFQARVVSVDSALN